eukprot:TRINITY_DN5116_c0_g1_i14.p1 TRINITY_DN5116_c0_g1~~TRINITY_DN5116_c0_g1_i14.p1  ORF type:complete len:213 (+),score=25.19 TRINITY_DN5116_c0_g1_i14:83-721(+)
MADRAPLPSYESTARGYQQQDIVAAPGGSPLDSTASLASPESASLTQQLPDASSTSLGAIITSSTLRPMPPSSSAPGTCRPTFGRRGRTQLKLASRSVPSAAHTLKDLPPAAADVELQNPSSDSLPDSIPARVRARQRQRFFGPALAWSYRQQRDMSRTLDFSDLLRQPPTPDEREEDSDSDASSIGSDLELDKDPEAISMRDLLQSKWSAG